MLNFEFGPNVIIEKNVMVEMRDGVRLATNVYRPVLAEPGPVLVTRLPYDKEQLVFLVLNLNIKRIFEAGYAIVIQDTRGRYASEGEFYPVTAEANDGADTIAWAARQPWSSGQVGMYGVSYQGITQWQAASAQPPALKAIAPTHAPTAIYPYRQGAFSLNTFLDWSLNQAFSGEMERRARQGRVSEAEMAELAEAKANFPELRKRLPLTDMPILQDIAPYYFDFLRDPAAQAARRTRLNREICQKVQVPALNVGGWYDYFLDDTLAAYQAMKEWGGSELARQNQQLIIGPWTHVDMPGMFRERDYGPQGNMRGADLTGRQLRWFDHWLKGVENGVEQDPNKVLIFVMGADVWREETDWPLPDTQYRPYYLRSGGHANTLNGDGILSPDAPEAKDADSFTYDPLNPVPTLGGAVMIEEPPESFQFNTGPLDQRQVEGRPDVLCYTTPPLERPVEVTGVVELVVYVSSSAPDTDFSGKLVDVYPDGRAEILTDGLLRARYRNSLTEPELMAAGQVYELRLSLGATSNLFKAGHRIRLDVSSSNFPKYDRNTNTGGDITKESASDLKTAFNTVYHDRALPSRLILPVIER